MKLSWLWNEDHPEWVDWVLWAFWGVMAVAFYKHSQWEWAIASSFFSGWRLRSALTIRSKDE